MSNFSSINLVNGTLAGTAPQRFYCSTPDSYAAMLVAGYLNDMSRQVKAGDEFVVNYADVSNFPLNSGEAALQASFRVQYDSVRVNWNLVPVASNMLGLNGAGFRSQNYSYAGGSASFVIADPNITPNSVVVGNLQSSANAVIPLTVLPGNGQISVVLSGDPGASVFSYFAVLPSVLLQNDGVFAASYNYAGGATTIVISNPSITAAMEVKANFASQANASEIESVVASAGAITIVCSANPGVSVVDYVAYLPSAALTALGLYGATYSNAGGSATITITDANIKANSIVVADFASQANGVKIEKVTPSAGSLTILASADPGVSVVNYAATVGAVGAQSGTFLLANNNLSDVQSASASVTNLGFTHPAANYLASTGALVNNHLLAASGTAGLVQDTGYTYPAADASANADATTIAAPMSSNGSKVLSFSNVLPRYATGSLTLAQFNALYATPIELVPAPGAGFMNVVLQFAVEWVYGSAAPTSGGALYLQYGNTAHGTNYATPVAGIPAAFFTGLSANSAISALGQIDSTSGLATSVCGNAAITMTNATADFATGTGGSLNWFVWYMIVPIS